MNDKYYLFISAAAASFSLLWMLDEAGKLFNTISHHAGGGSASGWFTLTSPTSHGGACNPGSAGCVCTDVHKCTPDAKINGVNLFKQGWLPTAPGSCRPDLTVYGKNYFDSNCCPDGTYGGPPRTGPFSVSCRGVQGTGAGYKG